MNGKVTADDLYYSAKMPFAFNYSDSNLVTDHARDNQGDHLPPMPVEAPMLWVWLPMRRSSS